MRYLRILQGCRFVIFYILTMQPLNDSLDKIQNMANWQPCKILTDISILLSGSYSAWKNSWFCKKNRKSDEWWLRYDQTGLSRVARWKCGIWQPCKIRDRYGHLTVWIGFSMKKLVDFAKRNLEIGWMVSEIWSNEYLQGCQVKIWYMAKWQPCKNRMRYRKSGFRFWFGMKKSVRTDITLVR